MKITGSISLAWHHPLQYHRQEFADASDPDKCNSQMSGDMTIVKFRSHLYDSTKKIRHPVEKEDEEDEIDPG